MSNIKNIVSSYLEDLEKARSQNTFKTYRQALRLFAEIAGDDDLTPDTYKKFLRETSDLHPSTQSTYRVAVMGLYLFYAADHPEQNVNIATLRQYDQRLALRRGERLPQFNRDAIERLIDHCSAMRNGLIELRDRAFVLTLADTGLRITEACNLRRGDIDWGEAQALVIGKGNKQASIYFSERALAAIGDYLAERAGLDGSSGKPLASLPLFARHDKGAGKKVKSVKSGGMWAAIKARVREAGIDPGDVRIHDLRHYFVTLVQLAGRDIRLTQELARHASISTTSRYAHLGGRAEELYREVFDHK